MKIVQGFKTAHVQNAQEKRVDVELPIWYDRIKVVKSCVIFLCLRLKMVLEAWF